MPGEHLLVARWLHHRVLAGLQKRLSNERVRFGSADRDQDIVGLGAWMQRRNSLAESQRTVDLRVVQTLLQQLAIVVEQLAQHDR